MIWEMIFAVQIELLKNTVDLNQAWAASAQIRAAVKTLGQNCLVESTIKQLSHGVQGTEKRWNTRRQRRPPAPRRLPEHSSPSTSSGLAANRQSPIRIDADWPFQ